MTDTSVMNLFGYFNLWLVVKFFVLVLIVMYFVLAAIIARQVDLMNQVLGTAISPLLRLVAVAHLFMVASLFFLAVTLI